MRITPEILLKVARDTVAERSKADRGILAIYMHGSLLEENPVLGGTADIDLFIVHNEEVGPEREIVRMTDDVHLDITHSSRSIYRHARDLRLHPWLGPTISQAKILYDPQHFMDFTQASVRGQFYHPSNVLERSRSLGEQARRIWLGFDGMSGEPAIAEIRKYLRAVELAADAIAGLCSQPLSERRFLLKFPGLANDVGHPGLYKGLLGLLGAPVVDAPALKAWLPAWHAAYLAVPGAQRPVKLADCRIHYYQRAFEAIIGSDQPLAVLWPLLSTWSLAIECLPAESSPEIKLAWQEAADRLGIAGQGFGQRLTALDAFLDTIEEILEKWAQENGA